MSDFRDELEALGLRLAAARRYLRQEDLAAELGELEEEMAEPGFWDDQGRAAAIGRRYNAIKEDMDLLVAMEADLGEGAVLAEFVEAGDSGSGGELSEILVRTAHRLEELELRSLLAGEFAEGDAIAEIHSGVGGTDAQDWAEMMLRMYERYAQSRGFDFELDEITPGQEAGILSATFIVKGRYAFGLLEAERGVHRLVRISPFDGQHRRQTSFASFDVTPLIETSTEVVIDEKDLRVDTFRSSGAGGQHVNVTDSAVRITHLPTGVVVSCQNERSQLQNKARAMQILISKLEQLRREEVKEQLSALSGPQVDVGWANQIRSYVLAPYQLVKDHRSGFEDRNVQAVIDGRLDPFIQAYLEWRRSNQP